MEITLVNSLICKFFDICNITVYTKDGGHIAESMYFKFVYAMSAL